MKKRSIFSALMVLVLATLACNVPAASTVTPTPTATVQTPTSTATSTPTASLTPTVTETPLIPVSGGQDFPQVSVSVSTNCRTGPSVNYAFVTVFNPGQTARIIGKYPSNNYWVINTPAGGVCWLWGQYATVTGDTTNIPLFAAPLLPTARFTSTFTPTTTIQPTDTPTFTPTELSPIGPGNLTQSRICDSGFRNQTPIWIELVTLNWQDNSTNETGYRIFRNNSALPSDLPADSTQFQMTLRYDQGTGGVLFDTFGVGAFNTGGVSAIALIDVPRCP